MHRSTARIAFTVLVLASALALAGCMDASLVQSGSGPASISIMDAPGAIDEVTINITGGGTNISETVNGSVDAAVFSLPVGQELMIDVDTTNYIGSKSFVLPPGGAQVNVQMLEKFFVPDYFNRRLVKVDDLSGAGWTVKDTGFAGALNRFPLDAQVGPDGAIYLVQEESPAAVIRIPSILGAEQVVIDGGTTGVTYDRFYSIAFDPSSGSLYATGRNAATFAPSILKTSLSGAVEAEFTGSNPIVDDFFGRIWGIAVGDSGEVYASGPNDDDPSELMIKRFDPDTGSVTWTKNLPGSGFPDQIDVTYTGGRLFATNPGGADLGAVLELDTNTGAVIKEYGSFPSDPDNPGVGEFYAPRRFLAVGRRKLYVVDDYGVEVVSPDNRIIGLDPTLNGSGWEVYGSEGNAQDEFDFYIGY